MSQDEIRARIDAIDREMRTLFFERMQCVGEISEIKEKQGLPIEDIKREQTLIASLQEGVCDDILPAYSSFVLSVLSSSKRYQAENRKMFLSLLPYPVTVRSGCLADIASVFDANHRVLLVTDDGVPSSVIGQVRQAVPQCFPVILPHGEEKKTPETAFRLLKTMADNGFDRHDCVLAVGGGTVGDLAGYVACQYMRGVDLYIVPTTLLAQADASVGGKNAVDFGGVKNLLGSFYAPKGVWIDPSLTDTLSDAETANGMAEIIKVFAALDKEAFEKLENSGLTKEEMIYRALACKAEIVCEDEKEKGLRRVLNFGHTVGHAVELTCGLTHGQAVGIGMLCVTEGETHDRIGTLLTRFGLPVSVGVDKELLLNALKMDKKSDGDGLTVVRVDTIGSYRFEKTTPEALVGEIGEEIDWQ